MPEDLAGFVRSRLAAVIVVADLDHRQAKPERAFEVEESPAGQPVARGLRGGLVDRLPDRARERRLPAVEGIHQRAPFKEPIVTPAEPLPSPPPTAAEVAPGSLRAVSTFSMPTIGASVNR